MIDLYYVDDQDGFLASLEMDVSIVANTVNLNLKAHAGAYQPEGFLKNCKPDKNAVYLLDISMTVPRELLRDSSLWPESKPNQKKDNFCGLALAKYLTNHEIAPERIALLTHWQDMLPEHDVAQKDLGLSLKAINKGDADTLQDWLGSLQIFAGQQL